MDSSDTVKRLTDEGQDQHFGESCDKYLRCLDWPKDRTAHSRQLPLHVGGRGRRGAEQPGGRVAFDDVARPVDRARHHRYTALLPGSSCAYFAGGCTVTCPRCQAPAREGARFCEQCGARLATTCPSCNAEIAQGSRFCGACGTPLAGAAPTPARFGDPQTYTPKHLADKILAARDPEEARKLLDPVLERMMEAVHRYEGTVNQVMGDGIMALFGAPVSHEDHAVRACHAALRMQETVGWYADELRRSQGIDVQIRVGLNSGEVVVRAIDSDLHMDYSAIGQTTHLAARMEQLARPGTALMSRETLRLAEGYVEVH